MQREERKKHLSIKKLLKVILKPSNLFILVLLLSVNSYAWFIYISRVNTSIDAHVSSWKITMDGDDDVTQIISLTIDDMKPGMDDYTDSFPIENFSEVSANVTYQILSIRFADETTYSTEGRAAAGEEAVATDLTNDEMITKLGTYPFKINIGADSETISAAGGATDFKLTVKWPYESGNDELDTEYGTKAAAYKESNPTSPTLEMKIKVTISQK